MTDKLNVSELDFGLIKNNLKDFLRQQSEFQDYDFDGAGLNILLDILAYNTHYNSYYLNMIANESFLDSSVLRNSVVSHAKKLGYVPRSAKAPKAIVDITVVTNNTTAGSLTIPKGYSLFSTLIDGVSYRYVTLDDVSVDKVGTNFSFKNVPIYQGEFVTYSFLNSYGSNPKQLFTIPDSNIDTSTLSVSVKQSTSNTDTIVYDVSSDIMNINSESEVYFIQESRDGKYDVYFGDNILGKKIPDGGVVITNYVITKGEEGNGANNFTATSPISGLSNITVNPVLPASGGSARETVDQIKYAAPLSLLSQNRAVTKNDYIRLIQQKYPQFDSVNVWGGEENNPPIYGKVFVSAKPKLGFEITQTEKEFIKESILRPMSILTVTPEIIDVDYNYLKVETDIYYNKSKYSGSDSQLKTSIKNVVLNYCDINLNQFNTYFQYSGLETAIDSYDRSIISNEVNLFVAKKFRPDLINSDNYILDFGFELSRGTISDNFYSSPLFTMADEDGVDRQCLFEEIPSSFTGVESITVTNPGYGYTLTPTVEIIGDGEGATARAVIVNGKISMIEVLTPGINYTTAAVRIIGGGGSLGAGSAVLDGRYGQIRISYFKTDEVSSQSTKVIINKNLNNGVTGIIDYTLGIIYINNFNPKAVNNNFGDISIHIKPKNSIIQSKLNKMLVLDENDPTSVVVKTVQV
jgi:hypothetical protein